MLKIIKVITSSTMLENALGIDFQNTFAKDLEGLYKESTASVNPSAEILLLNENLAIELGMKKDKIIVINPGIDPIKNIDQKSLDKVESLLNIKSPR